MLIFKFIQIIPFPSIRKKKTNKNTQKIQKDYLSGVMTLQKKETEIASLSTDPSPYNW